MRIALAGTRGVPANYGGFETFAEELSARLVERGHQVTIVSRDTRALEHDRTEAPRGRFIARETVDGIDVRNFPEEVIDRAWKRVPPEWIDGDEEALERLLERLFERRKRLPELIDSCRQARVSPFPNWL